MKALDVDLQTFFNMVEQEDDPEISSLILKIKTYPRERQQRVIEALQLLLKDD